MNITKYEHACVVVSESDANLVIDPGSFYTSRELDAVAAIVITHEHVDHWKADNVRAILNRNSSARVFGPAGVATAVGEAFPVEVVSAGDAVTIGPFQLRFFGGTHNMIHESVPLIDNVGVLVNEQFYYGGDSYVGPGVPVAALAVPIGGPWVKVSEVMDYVLGVKPGQAFYVHDAPLSPAGRGMASPRLKWATEQGGGTYVELEPGGSIEI